MDEPFGDLSRDEDVHGYIRTTQENFVLITQISTVPMVLQVMESVTRLAIRLFPDMQDKVGMGRVTRYQVFSVVENGM